MIDIGTLDEITSVVGERGTGKSTFALLDAKRFQRESGGLVIGHSPNGQIGRHPDIEFHDSIKSLMKAIRKRPEKMQFIASGASPEEVIFDVAVPISRSMRKRAIEREGFKFRENRPPPKGVAAVPTMVIIDEGTHLEAADTYTKVAAKKMQKLLTSARHKHLALMMLIQAPTARSWVFQEQANRFRVFRYVHEWGSNAIRAAGLPKEHLERIRAQPKFQFFRWDKENPLDGRFVRLPSP